MSSAHRTDQRAGDPVRVALLVSHAAHYLAPAYRALAAESTVRLRVYFWRASEDGAFDDGFGRHVRWSSDLYSGYDWWSPTVASGRISGGLALLRQLMVGRPQVILTFGWASLPARLGILFAIAARVPLLFYGDTNGRVADEQPKSKLRHWLLRRLFASAAGAIDTGVANRVLYRDLGMSEEQIHRGVLPVDVAAFAGAAARRRSAPTPMERPPLVIAYVGKFLEGKAPDDLIHAVARLPRDGRWVVWLIGDGPTRAHLQHLVEQYGLTDLVRFLGFSDSHETPALMAASDVLVLPSRRESRGLVAVEALAAGSIPVVSSATGVWGAGDAVEHGITGLVYQVGDTAELAACLQRLIDDDPLRTRLTAEGQNRAIRYGPSEFAGTAATALVDAASRGGHVTSR